MTDDLLYIFAEYASEGGCSPLTPESSIHTEILGSQQAGSPASAQSELIPEAPLASVRDSPENYTQDFTSVSQSHMSKVCMDVCFCCPCCISVSSQMF